MVLEAQNYQLILTFQSNKQPSLLFPISMHVWVVCDLIFKVIGCIGFKMACAELPASRCPFPLLVVVVVVVNN